MNLNEEDQLNRINLQALQNRDPFINKILDQAQRVCVYKFISEKREWERKDLEGTLFVYERSCEPYHGFVILSTVSRDTFVQIIKPSMEFKHSPNYEAFLQYKVDVGDIYGLWFISKNDCPRVTECLINLTTKAKEGAENKSTISSASSDIFSLLNQAQEKFQEKRKQDTTSSLPSALSRLFTTQEQSSQPNSTGEREQELKKALGIISKTAKHVVTEGQQQQYPLANQRLMTPAEFQHKSPTLHAPESNDQRKISKDTLRLLLIDMLHNDEEFITSLHNAYTDKQNSVHRIY